MDDIKLCAAVCGSRSAHEKLTRIGLNAMDFSEAGRCVVESAGEQYRRDADLRAVDQDVLRSQVERRFGVGSMATSVMEFVSSFPSDISRINVIEEYRLLRLERTATELATMLATGQHGETTAALLAKYRSLSAGEEGEQFKARLTEADFDAHGGALIPVYPRSLKDYVGGGVRRGHNILVYGRPNSGKTMFALNWAAGLCVSGYKVLYVANEETPHDLTERLLARLTGCPIRQLKDAETRRRAFKYCLTVYANWTLLHKAGCSLNDIARACQRSKPDVVFVDQLQNITSTNDNKVLQLDALARGVRNIAIEQNCVTVSITQSGESGEGKLRLTMTDVDWSNTGIPGAADLMIGIGVDDEYLTANKRMISIPKNKVNGHHGSFPVWVDPSKTQFLSRARG